MSYRDFAISILSVVLLLIFFMSLDYASGKGFIGDTTPIKWTLFFLILLVTHMLYKVVHKRSNNFMGRNIHDYIFLLSFVVLQKVQSLIFGYGVTYGTSGLGSLVVVLIFLAIAIMIFELMVSFFKRLLLLFKWQIL